MKRIPNKKRALLFKRLRYLWDIEYYSDVHRLDSDVVMEKYGHWGGVVYGQTEVRFHLQEDAFTMVRSILDAGQEYYFIPVTMEVFELFTAAYDEIDAWTNEHEEIPKTHFIILHPQLKWVLIKNQFNKVMGMGEPVKIKMRSLLVEPDWKRIMYIIGLTS